jgi:hypothetical protein
VTPLEELLARMRGQTSQPQARPQPIRPRQRRDALVGILAVTLVVALAACAVGLGYTYNKVHLLNDLDVPVTARVRGITLSRDWPPKFELGIEEITLDPHGRAVVWAHTGPQTVTVEAAGRTIEEVALDTTAWTDFIALNVLGAAPLYDEPVEYGRLPEGYVPALEPLAGQSVYTTDAADFVLEDAPATIEVSHAAPGGSVIRHHIDVAQGGWQTSLDMLNEKGRLDIAARLAAAVADVEPDSSDAAHAAVVQAWRLGGFPAGLAASERLVKASPFALTAVRLRSDCLVALGRAAEAQTLAREAGQGFADPVWGAYVVARLMPLDAATKLLTPFLTTVPDLPLVHWHLGTRFLAAQRYADALPWLAALAGGTDADWSSAALLIRALIGLGRTPEAVARAARYAQSNAASTASFVIAYASLLARAPDAGALPPLEPLVRRLGDRLEDPAAAQALVAAATGDADLVAKKVTQIKSTPLRQAIQLVDAIGHDADRAVALAAAAPPAVLEWLDGPQRVLLAAELRRRGDDRSFARLMPQELEVAAATPAIVQFLDAGVEAPALETLDLGDLAALRLIRARVLASRGEPSKTWLERSATTDALSPLVAQAAQNWRMPSRR